MRFTIKWASPCAFSDRALTIDAFTRLNERTKHGVDARLVAFAVRLKPFKDIAIQADMNVLLGGRQAYSDLAFPIVGQRPFVPVGQPFNFRPGHCIDTLPVSPALAARDLPSDLVSRKARYIFALPHLLPS